MSAISNLIENLQRDSEISVIDQSESWLLRVSRHDHFISEIIIPKISLEWFASIISRDSINPIWSDWMDYNGYNNHSRHELEKEMTQDISNFVDRVINSEDITSIQIYHKSA